MPALRRQAFSDVEIALLQRLTPWPAGRTGRWWPGAGTTTAGATWRGFAAGPDAPFQTRWLAPTHSIARRSDGSAVAFRQQLLWAAQRAGIAAGSDLCRDRRWVAPTRVARAPRMVRWWSRGENTDGACNVPALPPRPLPTSRSRVGAASWWRAARTARSWAWGDRLLGSRQRAHRRPPGLLYVGIAESSSGRVFAASLEPPTDAGRRRAWPWLCPPHLAAVPTPVVGTTLTPTTCNVPITAALQRPHLLSFGADSTRERTSSFLGAPGRLQSVNLGTAAVQVVLGSPLAIHQLPIPNQRSLVGLVIHGQAAALVPGRQRARADHQQRHPAPTLGSH